MCRIVAYAGPLVRLSRLIQDAPHALVDQSRDARLMTDSSVAGDGWGVGWFCPEAGPEPGLIKSVLPLWSDQNGRTATRAILSGSVVGHVRLASSGTEACFLNTPLYALDGRLWTINGSIEPWPGPISRALRGGPTRTTRPRSRGRRTRSSSPPSGGRTFGAGGVDAGEALRATLREARDVVRRLGGTFKANVLVADEAGGVAARFSDSGEPNSLFYAWGEDRWLGGALVASEPLDDGPGWREVGPNSLVRFDGGGVSIEPLDLDAAACEPAGLLDSAPWAGA